MPFKHITMHQPQARREKRRLERSLSVTDLLEESTNFLQTFPFRLWQDKEQPDPTNCGNNAVEPEATEGADNFVHGEKSHRHGKVRCPICHRGERRRGRSVALR